MLRDLSVCFAAGVFGGLANSLFIWAGGHFGLAAGLGLAIAPAWTPPWLYQRLVWGGIWGLAFMLPLLKHKVLLRGAVFSLGPSAVQLLVVFPHVANKGLWGLDLGSLTPLYVLVANAVWGVAAALWADSCQGQTGSRRSF